jgi:hypothetical protein
MLDKENIEDSEEILAADDSLLWWALSLDGIEPPRKWHKNPDISFPRAIKPAVAVP